MADAVLATVLSLRMPGTDQGLSDAAFNSQELTAFRTAFLFAGCLAVAGVFFSFFVRDSDAAGTMKARTPKTAERIVPATNATRSISVEKRPAFTSLWSKVPRAGPLADWSSSRSVSF